MQKEDKELIKLTVKEILLSFVDFGMKINEVCGYKIHKQISRSYFKKRDIDKNYLDKRLWEMEKRGYIKKFIKEKENYLELTPVGKEKMLKIYTNEFRIVKPKTWDKKWRIVIFDIPEDKKTSREILRERLKKVGFYQLQKSVFIYPYDCWEQIRTLKYVYCLGPYLQYILAENIETEINLVDHFYTQGVLNK